MTLPESAPSLTDVRNARTAIAGLALATPLIAAPALSALAGQEILLKLESLQPIGAFKLRGAANAVSRLTDEQRKRGIGCCSTGNHGRAIAYAAARAGVRATICLSALVPDTKVRAIQLLGAEVRRIGNSQAEAQAEIGR